MEEYGHLDEKRDNVVLEDRDQAFNENNRAPEDPLKDKNLAGWEVNKAL